MVNSRNAISHISFSNFIKKITKQEEQLIFDQLVISDSFFNATKELFKSIKDNTPSSDYELSIFRARVAPICLTSPFFPWHKEKSETFATAVPEHSAKKENFYIPQKNGEILKEQLGARPDECTSAARWNFDKNSVFYAAEDIETAITEVRAEFNRHVWISKYKIESLKLLNLYEASLLLSLSDDELQKIISNISPSIFKDFMQEFDLLVSTPCPNDETLKQKHYRPTQFISRLIHECGFDGFIYRSSLTEKRCYVIFNKEVPIFEGYQVYKVTRLIPTFLQIFPDNLAGPKDGRIIR
jgi:hypothetical protein